MTVQIQNLNSSFRILLCAFVMILGFASTSSADTEKLTKEQKFVQNLSQEALDSLETHKNSDDAVEKAVRKWLKSYFDKDTIAKFTLGRHWRTASKAQKAEFKKTFEGIVIRTYKNRLKDYSGQTFTVNGQSIANKRDTIVHSEIIRANPNAPRIKVDWRVRNKKGKLRIVDISVEGISMSVTQRADFDASIQRNGGDLDIFLAKLSEKLG